MELFTRSLTVSTDLQWMTVDGSWDSELRRRCSMVDRVFEDRRLYSDKCGTGAPGLGWD
jgi:hypothetical protein